MWQNLETYTVKLACTQLPANAEISTCASQLKRPHTQITCVTCSLPVKTGKITRVYAARTSRRIHANCLQPHISLPEHNGYFTGNFTCRAHASLPATSMQNCFFCKRNHMQFSGKNTRIAG